MTFEFYISGDRKLATVKATSEKKAIIAFREYYPKGDYTVKQVKRTKKITKPKREVFNVTIDMDSL